MQKTPRIENTSKTDADRSGRTSELDSEYLKDLLKTIVLSCSYKPSPRRGLIPERGEEAVDIRTPTDKTTSPTDPP